MAHLTHYTRSIDTIIKILINGFAWIPNGRDLITHFIPFHDFLSREPQQFGMVSFTELPPENAAPVRHDFGNYGITVSAEWALSQNAQRVLYIDYQGPVFDGFQRLFQYAYGDLICSSQLRTGAVSSMIFTNRAMANITRAFLYGNLLKLYEYMEPSMHSYQQEWRITNPEPLYGFKETKEEIIENVSPPKGWAKILHLLRIESRDVTGFVCPEHEVQLLRNSLSDLYKDKTIAGF
ncbi:MAG: hypothetical protein C0399_04785 [Syntrophus sp. (in: bacteria)]|nr:hypothetical protein [Syntrophus sp. (in: bacteria)]